MLNDEMVIDGRVSWAVRSEEWPDVFRFVGYGFDWENRVVRLKYAYAEQAEGEPVHEFEERYVLPASAVRAQGEVDLGALERALFVLHLMAGTGYYKAYAPEVIEVCSGVLSGEQAGFWNNVYTKGLGEFFYTNGIDFRGTVNFPSNDEGAAKLPGVEPADIDEAPACVLVPVGGGKDSVVTAESLREAGVEFDLFRMGGHEVVDRMGEMMEANVVEVEREFDRSLTSLNEAGAWNGHVPITGIEMALGVVVAVLGGYSDVVFSNERSASVGNVQWLGEEINHQWSKSVEFEHGFDPVVREWIGARVRVFSFLRPVYELAILKVFAGMKEYHSVFMSCNRNFGLDSSGSPAWCGECPKCAFVFLGLAAFVGREAVVDVFGKDMLADDGLVDLYRELSGVRESKPFECVGTYDEVRSAFELVVRGGEFDGAVVLKMYEDEIRGGIEDVDEVINSVMTIDDNLIAALPEWARDVFVSKFSEL